MIAPCVALRGDDVPLPTRPTCVFYKRAVSFVLLWLVLLSWSHGQIQAAEEVDVLVHMVAPGGLFPDKLISNDFRLTQANSPVRFTLQRFQSANAASTYALLDLARCPVSQAPAASQMSRELASMFRLRWRVSVLDADGAQTPFAASMQELANGHAVPGRSEETAVRSLNENAGLHLVFAICGPAVAIPPRVVAASNQALAAFFTIVAGSAVYRTDANPSQWVTIVSNEQQIAAFNGFGGLTRSRLTPQGRPLDQPSVADAVVTAQLFASECYLLHVGRLTSLHPLTLSAHLPDRSQMQYQIAAVAYSDGTRAPRVIIAR